jgi:hypothetical protein
MVNVYFNRIFVILRTPLTSSISPSTDAAKFSEDLIPRASSAPPKVPVSQPATPAMI